MKHILSLILLFTASELCSQTADFAWAKQVEGTHHTNTSAVCTDHLGNVYVTGRFRQTADLDPGPGVQNATASGIGDYYVQKFDPSGNLIWAKHMAGTYDAQSESIAADSNGNVLITGWFNGSVDFDPGTGNTTLTSSSFFDDIFVQKLDPNGNLIWAKSMGGNNDETGRAITVDNEGSVYTVGWFSNTVDFDPGVGTANLTAISGNDAFIQKLDANGDLVWVRQLGGSNSVFIFAVHIDDRGNVITTGNFGGTVDFNPGSGTFNQTALNFYDCFIHKMDANGNFKWVKQMGGTNIQAGRGIAADTFGNVYTTGEFYNSVDFNPGSGTYNQSSLGGPDIWIQKLDSNGAFVWAKQIGSTLFDVAFSITLDHLSNVYVGGVFQGTADFDPGAGTTNLTSAGNYDSFILKLESNGDYVWSKQISSTDFNELVSLRLDKTGNIYSVGSFTDTADFDPGPAVHELSITTGYSNAYVHKLSQCLPVYSFDNIAACDSFTWSTSGMTYDTSGTYTAMLTSSAGCDSIATIYLKIHGTSGEDTAVACDEYAWPTDGNTYTSTGDYMTTLTNAIGCDSLVTLHLTILESSTSTQSTTACYNYTWQVNGMNYSSTGTYAHTLTNAAGCDSVITLDLVIDTVDVSTSDSAFTITAEATNASYQWLYCDSGFTPISNETSSSFTAISNGNYAVEVTQNNCVDTSDCIAISGLGLASNIERPIRIYPNPSQGEILIDLGSVNNAKLTVFNAVGQIIANDFASNGKVKMEIVDEPGIYFIMVQAIGFNQSYAVVITP